MKKFSVKGVVAIGIGAALFFLFGMISIPSPVENTYISLQYAIEALFATLLGPIIGLLIGFIGHTCVDVYNTVTIADYTISWSWIIASSCVGLVIGLVMMKINVSEGVDANKLIRFNVAQVAAHLLAWGIIAPCLDILIYSELIGRAFAQALMAGITNIITTGIAGTLLVVAYAKLITTNSSLNEND